MTKPLRMCLRTLARTELVNWSGGTALARKSTVRAWNFVTLLRELVKLMHKKSS